MFSEMKVFVSEHFNKPTTDSGLCYRLRPPSSPCPLLLLWCFSDSTGKAKSDLMSHGEREKYLVSTAIYFHTSLIVRLHHSGG